MLPWGTLTHIHTRNPHSGSCTAVFEAAGGRPSAGGLHASGPSAQGSTKLRVPLLEIPKTKLLPAIPSRTSRHCHEGSSFSTRGRQITKTDAVTEGTNDSLCILGGAVSRGKERQSTTSQGGPARSVRRPTQHHASCRLSWLPATMWSSTDSCRRRGGRGVAGGGGGAPGRPPRRRR